MGYRSPDKKPNPEDMLRRFTVRNGSVMRATFNCNYLEEGHEPRYHDYRNWPAPNYHPGPVCQMVTPRDRFRWFEYGCFPGRPVTTTPIHLFAEDYTDVEITYEEADLAEHLTSEVYIDPSNDSVVRLKILANFPTFVDVPKEIHFTVFIKKPNGIDVDALCHGILVVLPGSPSTTG